MQGFHGAAEAYGIGDFRAWKLPGRAESQPILGIFVLPAIFNRLPEQAVVVTDTIAIRGDGERRHALHETGREPPEAAVAERRVGLHVLQLVEIDIEACQGLAHLGGKPEIVQRVHKQASDEEFKGHVIDAPSVLLGHF